MFVSTNSLVANSTADAKMSVLVVDDEEKLGRFVCMLLKRVGYHTYACRSVAEARQLLQDKSLNLVITDIVMPRENGFELVRWIGENFPQIPIVVMTAHSTDAVENQAARLGVSAILHKPFTIDGLRQTIEEAAPLTPNGKDSF
jgi:two-component system response regulator PilR (NtrC family)